MGKYEKHEVLVVKSGILNGAKVEYLRQSPRTGCLTVKLVEKLPTHGPAFKIGDEIYLHPYEVDRKVLIVGSRGPVECEVKEKRS